MKGYRFYAEMPEARKSKAASKANPFFPWTRKGLADHAAQGGKATLIVVPLDETRRPNWGHGLEFEGLSVAIDNNHYSYCWTMVHRDYVTKRATRITAELARALSPEAFRHLES